MVLRVQGAVVRGQDGKITSLVNGLKFKEMAGTEGG